MRTMLTLPSFKREGGENLEAKIAFLRERFRNRRELDSYLEYWTKHIGNCDNAIYMSGAITQVIGTILSGIQTAGGNNSVNASISKYLDYSRTALSVATVFIGAICGVIRRAYNTARQQLLQFDDAFFIAHSENTIWPQNPIAAESLANQVSTIPTDEDVGHSSPSRKIDFINNNFKSRSQFESTLNDWSVTVRLWDMISVTAAIIASLVTTVLSGFQTGIVTGTESEPDPTTFNSSSAGNRIGTISNNTQFGLNVSLLVVGLLSQLFKRTAQANLDKATTTYNHMFFEQNKNLITYKQTQSHSPYQA